MPVSMNATAEGQAVIEAYWPHGMNEDTYGEISQNRLDRATRLDEAIHDLENDHTLIDGASTGATSDAIKASVANQIANFTRDADNARAIAAATAMESQNIFNTKNLLNAIAADYQGKWDQLTAENIATGGTQPMIQQAIEALRTIATVAAQVVAGGFGAAHQEITAQMQARNAMTAAPAMMPPALDSTSMYGGWGACPSIPTQYQTPSFFGSPSSSPMMYGDYGGGVGGLLSSLANAAPQMQAAGGQAGLSDASPGSYGTAGITGPTTGGATGGGGEANTPWAHLTQAAAAVTAGISGAANALGEALQDGPIADHAESFASSDTHTDTTGGDGAGGGGMGGVPRGGGGDNGEATHQVTPVNEPDGDDEPPVEVTTETTQDTASGAPGLRITGSLNAELSTQLTAGAAATATASFAGPSVAPAGGGFTGGFAGYPAVVDTSSLTRNPSSPSRPSSWQPSGTMVINRAKDTGDTADKPAATPHPEPTDPVVKGRMGLSHLPEGTPAAVAVYDDKLIVGSGPVLGMPLDPDHTYSPAMIPLALSGVSEAFMRTWLGYRHPDMVLTAAVADGEIPTPDTIVAVNCAGGGEGAVTYTTPLADTTKPAGGSQWPRVDAADVGEIARRARDISHCPDLSGQTVGNVVGAVNHRMWEDTAPTDLLLAVSWWALFMVDTAQTHGQAEYAESLAWLIMRLPTP